MSINTAYSVTSGLPVVPDNDETTKKDSGLDVSDFLKLLVTQLSNQDPLGGSSGSGSSSTDYISQLAQFTMLQQLSDLSSSFLDGQAYSLIGKYVYLDTGTGSDLTFGKVDGVIKESGVNYLMVGGQTYELSKVYAVEDEDTAVAAINDQALKSAELIGKQVTAVTETADGKSTISGTVDKIHINNGVVYLQIDGEEVALDTVTEIAATDTPQNI